MPYNIWMYNLCGILTEACGAMLQTNMSRLTSQSFDLAKSPKYIWL